MKQMVAGRGNMMVSAESYLLRITVHNSLKTLQEAIKIYLMQKFSTFNNQEKRTFFTRNLHGNGLDLIYLV